MLYGVISRKNLVINTIGMTIFIPVMFVSCQDEGFRRILFVDLALFFFFIVIQSELYRKRTQINLLLQGKNDKKSKLILKIVNKIVEFKLCGRDEVYFDVVTELQNDKDKLDQQNSQLIKENENVNKEIIEKNAIIKYISNDRISAIYRIEQSINGVHATFTKGFRAVFSNVNSYKERELKENILELEHKTVEVQRKRDNARKQQKKADAELQYTTEKNKILNSVQDKIRHSFEGKERVSKTYIRTLVQVLCKDASISYSDKLSNEIYELLPPDLVLKGKGGKPCQAVIDATKKLEKELEN